MKTLYLVRHGDYEYRDTRSETEGQGLTDVGLQQAQATAEWLRALQVNINAVHSSDYLRAFQTAEAISTALNNEPKVSEKLRECSDIYYREILQVPFSAEAAFEQYFVPPCVGENHQHEIVVCHANLIRYFLSRINEWSKEEWRQAMIPNCSVTEVLMDVAGTLTVGLLASDAHLPDELRESLDDFDW